MPLLHELEQTVPLPANYVTALPLTPSGTQNSRHGPATPSIQAAPNKHDHTELTLNYDPA